MEVKFTTKIIKRAIDIIFAIIGLTILVPLTIVVFILNILFREKGPIFYSQKRVGLKGKQFKMYKFRSMAVDADDRLKKLLESDPNLKREFEKTFKLKHDPRVTKIGHFLRKTSLDEFPQFLNVLIGNMSIVGPRPIVMKEWTDYYKEDGPKCFSMKPGITGMWQAYARSHVDNYQQRIALDLEYINNFSLFLDAKIIFLTIISVLKSKGAY